MKLSQAVLVVTLLATRDAMSIRGISDKYAVVNKDDLAKATTLPIKDVAAINNGDEEQHGLLRVEEGERLLTTTIISGMDAISNLHHEHKAKAKAVLEQQGGHRQLSYVAGEPIALGACEDFAVMAGSTATCAGSSHCDIIGGYLAVSPGTSITGNFDGNLAPNMASTACATNGLDAWKTGRAKAGDTMFAEMGGKTFTPGVYVHKSAINIALTNPVVYLDAAGVPDAQFIFNIGSTLTTSAMSKIVLLNGAKADNVFWVLGTALTMGADSILVGNVLAGTAITMGTKAKIMGRAIAQTAMTCETACAVETSGRHSAFPSSAPTASATAKNYPVPEDATCLNQGKRNTSN